jgi:hypothetical protein
VSANFPPPPQRAPESARPLPSGRLERELEIRGALARLGAEERRLHRLGMVRQADGLRRERRYWEFLEAVFSLDSQPTDRRI